MQTSSKRIYLLFLIGLSLLLTIAAVYAVRSGLVITLTTYKGLFIIGGSILLYASVFAITKAYVDRELPTKTRLMILFGPGASGGFAGVASLSLGLIPAVLPENFLLLSGVLALLSFVSFQVAIILGIISSRNKEKGTG